MVEMGRSADYDHYLTIFIPAYNRAEVLDETLGSIVTSTFRDFEVLIVDDGSSDGTRELVESWIKKSAFPIKYVYQDNQGKAGAHNTALNYARGFLFFSMDAGDSILPEALGEIKKNWENIPENERNGFAGICGLCILENGTVSGGPFNKDVIDSDYNEIYSLSLMKNEKRSALRLQVLKEYPYPRIEGEKHHRDTLILRRMSHKYKIRFVNVPVQIYRKEVDGSSKHIFQLHMKNPKAHRLFHLEEINVNDRYHTRKKLYRLHVHYVRFSLHSGVGILAQASEINHRFFWLLSLPRGINRWFNDMMKIRFGRADNIYRSYQN